MFNSYHLCLWSFPCNSCQQQVSFSWVYWLVMAPVLCCSYIKLWLISWFWKFCPNLSNTYNNILNLSVFNNCESSPGALHFPCLSSPFLFFHLWKDSFWATSEDAIIFIFTEVLLLISNLSFMCEITVCPSNAYSASPLIVNSKGKPQSNTNVQHVYYEWDQSPTSRTSANRLLALRVPHRAKLNGIILGCRSWHHTGMLPMS